MQVRAQKKIKIFFFTFAIFRCAASDEQLINLVWPNVFLDKLSFTDFIMLQNMFYL